LFVLVKEKDLEKAAKGIKRYRGEADEAAAMLTTIGTKSGACIVEIASMEMCDICGGQSMNKEAITRAFIRL